MRYGFDGGCLACAERERLFDGGVRRFRKASGPGNPSSVDELSFSRDGKKEIGGWSAGAGIAFGGTVRRERRVGGLEHAVRLRNWEDSSVSATLHDFIFV